MIFNIIHKLNGYTALPQEFNAITTSSMHLRLTSFEQFVLAESSQLWIRFPEECRISQKGVGELLVRDLQPRNGCPGLCTISRVVVHEENAFGPKLHGFDDLTDSF